VRAFYPTDALVTARDIIFLWVARMVMMGLEFTGDTPFSDVYITPVIQAPDGRRMSKSLGTGIDPLDEIDAHGADSVRFGLLAMSSTQDVRYNAARIQQGQDLANKMWNASRLVLLNTSGAEARPATTRIEDRWIASRLQRVIAVTTAQIDGYDFAHAALGLYEHFWSELCDWYLEIVKPRLYEGDRDAASMLLWLLEQTLALIHPVMPFVTEEIYSYLRDELGDDAAEMLVVHPYPEPDPTLVDEEAEREVAAWIDVTRQIRRWRDMVGVAAASVLPARVAAGDGAPHELVARLARLAFDGAEGEALTTIGPVEIVASDQVDADQARERIAERREALRAEVARAEGKLANAGFVDKAPADVVDAERAKLARYQTELEELDRQ
jgi:valyl-tRNA synthetase